VSAVPLTAGQVTKLDVLVKSGRLLRVQADLAKAIRFLDQAADALAEVGHVQSPRVRYDIGYNAAHDVGEAMLAAFGYRTGRGDGQHVMVGAFLAVIFDSPPASVASRKFDRMRTGRNGMRYEATPVGDAQAQEACDVALALHAAGAGLTTQ
jgi:hypothetical protein